MLEPKKKPCKGTGIAKENGCGKPVLDRVYGLGKYCCYVNWLLNTKEGQEKRNKSIIKVQKPRKQFEKAKVQKTKETTLKMAHNSTKSAVHAYIRDRDRGKPCISCKQPHNNDFQAGHFHKAELFETLKYNLANINGQCVGCNIHNEGNLDGYIINLPYRIGKQRFDALESLAAIDKTRSKVWDIESLKAVRDCVRKLHKELPR